MKKMIAVALVGLCGCYAPAPSEGERLPVCLESYPDGGTVASGGSTCARCAEVVALVRPASEVCRPPVGANLPSEDGVSSGWVLDALGACLCTGGCSDVCATVCDTTQSQQSAWVEWGAIDGACSVCLQREPHSSAEGAGCAPVADLCANDSPP